MSGIKFMGKDPNGLAKAVNTNSIGNLNVALTSITTQIADSTPKQVSNQNPDVTVIDEFINPNAQYVQYGLCTNFIRHLTSFVIESIIEGGEFGLAHNTVFRIEETLKNSELPSEGIIFDTRSSSMKLSPTASLERFILFTHKIPLLGHKTRFTMQVKTDPVYLHSCYYYAVSRRFF